MRRMRSLRARLIGGAIAWMIALIVVVNLLASFFIARNPRYETRRRVHEAALTIVAIGFVVAGRYLVTRGLAPFSRLHDALRRVREGASPAVAGEYPAEVQPLVDDLNALLADRDKAMRRALASAGDLAHALKTPLAVLGQQGERAAREGHGELAASIAEQVDRMKSQVEYQLTLARAVASAGTAPGVRCSIDEAAQAIARTLRKLNEGREIRIDVRNSDGAVVRMRREDVDEILGNLMDNACKWARTGVSVESSVNGDQVVVDVDDDGPGLPPELRAAVMQRGVRADQSAPGSGLGLAIAADLAELYGGSVALEASPAGGVRARLTLPRAGAAGNGSNQSSA